MTAKQSTPSLRAAIVTVTPFQQNCTILFDQNDKQAVVVDPGGDVPMIKNALDELGVSVEKILLTHGHIDHAGGVEDLKETLGDPNLRVIGPHIADKVLLDGLEEQAKMFGVGSARNCTPDQFLTEDDTIDIGGYEFASLHCPGHSPGSLVYVNKDIKFAIMGDVLFQGSIGRTDLPYGNHEELMTSIHNKILPLGDDVSFICGHGPGSTIGVERRSNPFIRV